jgi:hypothetical protein
MCRLLPLLRHAPLRPTADLSRYLRPELEARCAALLPAVPGLLTRTGISLPPLVGDDRHRLVLHCCQTILLRRPSAPPHGAPQIEETGEKASHAGDLGQSRWNVRGPSPYPGLWTGTNAHSAGMRLDGVGYPRLWRKRTFASLVKLGGLCSQTVGRT